MPLHPSRPLRREADPRTTEPRAAAGTGTTAEPLSRSLAGHVGGAGRSGIRGHLVVVGLVLAVAMLAVACSSSERPAPQVFDLTTTPDGAEAPITVATTAPPPPYEVTYLGQSCPFAPASAAGFKVDCGQLIVPMRRDQPTEKKAFVSVAIVRSSSPTPLPDPVVYLAGGPGGSAIAGIDMWTNPATPILENRDLILVDQRGTGYSGPRLNCDRAFIDAPTAAAEDRRPGMTKCVEQLAFDNIDTTAYNTDESAADLVDLRGALKLPTWNLFGISYGTRLGLRTMQLDPAGIRSVVLDSVYPPGAAGYDAAGSGDRAVEAILADCAAQPACQAAYPNLRGQLDQVLNRLRTNPYTEQGFDPGSGQIRTYSFGDVEFALVLFDALYVTEIIPDVPKAIAAAANGDLVESVELLTGRGAFERERAGSEDDGSEPVPPSARFRPLMTDGLFHSVECAESAPTSTAAGIDAIAAEGNVTLRRPLAEFSKRSLEVCEVWGAAPRTLAPTTSDLPTLVLAGTYDPITPPAWGELAASTLSASTFITVAGAGHAVYAAGPCAEGLVKQFFDDPAGALPDCTMQIPEFTR